MSTKGKIWITIVIGLVSVIAALGGVKAMQIRAMINFGKSFAPPPEAITTAKAENADWHASRAAVGTLLAVHNVMLASELPGRVIDIMFDSGQHVRREQELVKLDSSVEAAQLESALADQVLAQQTLARAKALSEHGSNTPADVEAAQAKAAATTATVSQLRATLVKKVIRAPFDGRIGIRQVELGQIVASNTPIASLQSVNPIYAEFWLPQQALGDLKLDMDVTLHSDPFPDSVWSGKLITINPEVDVATRNVRVRASFANADGRLRPGMYGSIEVLSRDTRQVLIIPATSVLYAPFGDSVFTVAEKKEGDKGPPGLVAQQRFIRAGERRGDYLAVESGLTAGETVVSSGVFKLRNGQPVVVKNDLVPDVQARPHPIDR